MRFEDETASRFEGGVDRLEKGEVAGVVEIGEGVAETEGVIESGDPGKGTHVPLLERGVQAIRCTASGFEEIARDVHARHAVAPPGWGQAQPAVAAGNVGDVRSGGRLEHTDEVIRLRLGLGLVIHAPERLDNETIEKVTRPLRYGHGLSSSGWDHCIHSRSAAQGRV